MNIAERFNRMYEMGCCCCLWNVENLLVTFRQAQIHHISHKGNKQTIPLCPWHHQGLPASPYNEEQTKRILGPSLRLHKKEFIETYGKESVLLERVNKYLEQYK